MKKNVRHKSFHIGDMVTVLWHKDYYVGKYHGYSGGYHDVRFPVYGPFGTKLQSVFVKDKYMGLTMLD